MDVLRAVNAVPPWSREAQVRPEVQLSRRESFHHQHGTGAGGTTQQAGFFGAICGANCAEQLAATVERRTASAVGEEAKMANADQAFGQDMDEKSAQELIG